MLKNDLENHFKVCHMPVADHPAASNILLKGWRRTACR
jgi:hypothetical protein